MKLQPPTDDTGHIWHEKVYSSMRIMCCMNCGFIKNEGKTNKPCPGPIGVSLRSGRSALSKETGE